MVQRIRIVRFSMMAIVCSVIVTACAIQAQAATPLSLSPPTTTITPPILPPRTATFDPSLSTQPSPQPQLIPVANSTERVSASNTRLYVTAFQSYNVSVVDPSSGHSLHTIPTTGDQGGMAVSPDGTRLYIVDGQGADDQLRVYETKTWQVIHRDSLQERAQLLGDNPISLSGDGHWLVVSHYSYARAQNWLSVFDTQKREFVASPAEELQKCQANVLPVSMTGRAGHNQLYGECGGFITARRADTLTPVWKVPKPFAASANFVLAPDGKLLYALYPDIGVSYAKGEGRVTKADTLLFAWDSATGNLVQRINLNDQVAVPIATFGRGGRGYLAITPDGARLYVGWEDRLWTLSSDDFRVTKELILPTPVDGLAQSVDGRALYLLPSTAGDLAAREHGLLTVDVGSFRLIRHAEDWPPLVEPFRFAAPAPK